MNLIDYTEAKQLIDGIKVDVEQKLYTKGLNSTRVLVLNCNTSEAIINSGIELDNNIVMITNNCVEPGKVYEILEEELKQQVIAGRERGQHE